MFLRILTFLPRKSREIGRFFREFTPENPAKFCVFFREISEALYVVTSVDELVAETFPWEQPSYKWEEILSCGTNRPTLHTECAQD